MMGRPTRSEKGKGSPMSLWLSPEANHILREFSEKQQQTLGRAASLLIETSSPEVAETIATQDNTIRTLTQESQEKDTIIARLKADLEALEKSQERSRKAVEVDLSRVHPAHRELVAKAMGAKA